MNKRTILALLIALPMSIFAQKFGVIDFNSIIQGMPEFTAMQTQIAEASKKYEDEYGKLREEFEKKLTEYQQLEQDANTPQAIKERRMQEMNDLDQKAQQFINNAQQDLQRMQVQQLNPIQQKVLEATKAIGQEGGYVFIFPADLAVYEGAMVEDVTNIVAKRLGVTPVTNAAAAPAGN
ncbi:MAG: OmpH family outer membrane protein [Clostridium sp.]|nr:OmpH family outer membrane protein [Clostridium sp.]